MLLYEQIHCEEEAIESLLRISSSEYEERLDFNEPCDSAMLRRKKLADNKVVENDHLLGPWDGEKSIGLVLDKKLEHSKKSTFKARDLPSQKSTLRHSNRRTSTKTQSEEKFHFCHFEDTREYITQYRENVTFSTMLDYRNGLMKTSSSNLCKKCEHIVGPHDLVKLCNCSSSTATSTSVCYAEPDSFSRYQVLSSEHNRINGDKKKLPGGGKLWISGSLKHSQNCIKNKVKSTKHKDLKNRSRCNVRMKTGNDSPDTLRIFTSPKGVCGPRMGSNRPPINDASELRCGTPTSQLISCLRPKIPQAAIPNKSTSFQACIMPMTVSANIEHSKTP